MRNLESQTQAESRPHQIIEGGLYHPTALTQKIQEVINADDADFDVDAEEVYFAPLIKNIALGPFLLWKC